MTTQWGIKVSTWPRIATRGSEESARAWIRTFTCSSVSPPWTELYRNDGKGWVLVERVSAEWNWTMCSKAPVGLFGHRWSDGVCWNCGGIGRLDVAVDHFGSGVDSVSADERVRLVRTRRPDLAAALRREAHEIEVGGGIVPVNDDDRGAVAERLRERAERLDGDRS